MSQQKSADWVRLAQSPSQTERIEAFFGGHGYEPHRHDTYAIGQTIAGVQSFHYRGGLQHSLPGGTMVLHPDEIHDGEAGTEAGFHYRMVYIEPALIQKILGGRPLPFIPRRPVGGSAPALRRAAVVKSGHGHLRAAGGRGMLCTTWRRPWLWSAGSVPVARHLTIRRRRGPGSISMPVLCRI